jgi:Domain of unknown function (DUF1707)
MMTGSRGTRASDADRERIAAALGEHHAAGRLTLEEFQERLDQAYAARTLGQLDDLMTDLPRTNLGLPAGQRGGHPPLPEQHAPGTVQARADGHPAIWQFWLGLTIAVFVIWLISGAAGGPWFLWVAIPLAFIMLRRWCMNAERRIREHQDRR